ncbi:MAG: hypothetical protein BZY82_03925 [SAR202 cluster bacterium Io17-Chloro-G3]|nr:MAG: hypothetical protein BZY82_03925 [SAR202 cluster bacterium Io17-Chloro-G3]
MLVDLVKVETRDRVRLDGILGKPTGSTKSQLGVDIVILHHGVTGNFYGPGMFAEYSDSLREQGCAVLRVNNRGHDPISQVREEEEPVRYGAAYEIVDDCRHDWEAWVTFAESMGYKRIGLWGHSLGAVKSIYYMAVQPDTRVTCVVASSPPRFSYSAYLAMEEGNAFKQQEELAQGLIREGKPDALMEADYPRRNLFTAKVFVDKYGPEERYNVLKHIPKVNVPILVTIGGAEGIVTGQGNSKIGFTGLANEVQQLEEKMANLTFQIIPDADHSYTHQRKYAWDTISSWLKKV